MNLLTSYHNAMSNHYHFTTEIQQPLGKTNYVYLSWNTEYIIILKTAITYSEMTPL